MVYFKRHIAIYRKKIYYNVYFRGEYADWLSRSISLYLRDEEWRGWQIYLNP